VQNLGAGANVWRVCSGHATESAFHGCFFLHLTLYAGLPRLRFRCDDDPTMPKYATNIKPQSCCERDQHTDGLDGSCGTLMVLLARSVQVGICIQPCDRTSARTLVAHLPRWRASRFELRRIALSSLSGSAGHSPLQHPSLLTAICCSPAVSPARSIGRRARLGVRLTVTATAGLLHCSAPLGSRR
jgi:hypothetical protein